MKRSNNAFENGRAMKPRAVQRGRYVAHIDGLCQ